MSKVDLDKLSFFCTEFKEDLNTENKDNIAQSLSETISDMINKHQETSRNADCSMASYSIEKTPETLFLMMKPNSTRLIAAQLILKTDIYELKAQISWKPDNQFYTRCKMQDGKYYKFDRNDSILKKTAADPKHTVVALYKKISKKVHNVEYLQKFIYPPKAIVYFRKSVEE